MADAVEDRIKVIHRIKPQSPLSKFSAPNDFRGQQGRSADVASPFGAKKKSFSPTGSFRPGCTSALHSSGACCAVSSTSTFPCKCSLAAGLRWTDPLRMNSRTTREQSRRKHPRVVQHQQIAGRAKHPGNCETSYPASFHRRDQQLTCERPRDPTAAAARSAPVATCS